MARRLPTRSKASTAGGSFYDSVEQRMNELRILDIVGIVDSSMAHELAMRLRFMASQNNEPITIYLNTPGGAISDGLSIYDLIRSISAYSPVHIVANGGCMSMGTIILQAATKRYATPHTHFMLHELQSGMAGSLSEMKDQHQHFEQLQKTLDDILTRRTGKSAQTLLKNSKRRDYFITAEEALKLNLIDAIIPEPEEN